MLARKIKLTIWNYPFLQISSRATRKFSEIGLLVEDHIRYELYNIRGMSQVKTIRPQPYNVKTPQNVPDMSARYYSTTNALHTLGCCLRPHVRAVHNRRIHFQRYVCSIEWRTLWDTFLISGWIQHVAILMPHESHHISFFQFIFRAIELKVFILCGYGAVNKVFHDTDSFSGVIFFNLDKTEKKSNFSEGWGTWSSLMYWCEYNNVISLYPSLPLVFWIGVGSGKCTPFISSRTQPAQLVYNEMIELVNVNTLFVLEINSRFLGLRDVTLVYSHRNFKELRVPQPFPQSAFYSFFFRVICMTPLNQYPKGPWISWRR